MQRSSLQSFKRWSLFRPSLLLVITQTQDDWQLNQCNLEAKDEVWRRTTHCARSVFKPSQVDCNFYLSPLAKYASLFTLGAAAWYFGQDHIKPVGIKIKVMAGRPDTGSHTKRRWSPPLYIEVSVLLSARAHRKAAFIIRLIALTQLSVANVQFAARCTPLAARFAQSNLAIKLHRPI
jgi:hypothetical protein